jgi:putative intracellular protease/amidase
VIERQLGYPATAVRVEDIADRALDQFDALVLPAGGDYAERLGTAGVERVRAFVEAGGVVIALGGATRFLANPDTELSALRRETAAREGGAKKNGDDEKKSTVAGVVLADGAAARKATVPTEIDPDASAGVLVTADVDPDHWLAAGVRPTLAALYTGGDIYAPLKLDEGVMVARFGGPDRLVASGHLWEETKRQLAYKPFVTVEEKGDGLVIAFAADPTTRAYLDGLNLILANALFRAPAHTGKLR